MTKVPCFVSLALFVSGYVDSAIVRLNDGGQGNPAVTFGSDVAYHKDIPGTVKQAFRLQDQNNYSTVDPDPENGHHGRLLKKNEDFAQADRDVRPSFREIQQSWSPVVFVLDVSYTMRGKGKVPIQQECFYRLMRHVIKDGDSVAIVAFGGRCEVVQNLTVVEGEATRDRLADFVNELRLRLGSSIGCGLRMGAEVLESNGRLGRGGTIFLISDGGENDKPYIRDELPKLVAKGVRVHTFSLDSSADKPFMEVAQKTGGKAYAFAEVMDNLTF